MPPSKDPTAKPGRPAESPTGIPATGAPPPTTARVPRAPGQKASPAQSRQGSAKSRPIAGKRQRPASARRALWLSALVILAVLAVVGAAFLGSRGGGQAEAAVAVRPESHRLGTPGSTGVTLTEFLDFECEACRAAYPLVEQLRQDYQGRVTFVVRYFPIPSHTNSTAAAVAVQAASEQGQLEAMYARMYETQEQWGEQPQATPEVFRAMASQLGLDMAAYDASVADPATTARVRSDYTEGVALGVQGTPTFFLNEEKIEPSTEQEFRDMLDRALAEAGQP